MHVLDVIPRGAPKIETVGAALPTVYLVLPPWETKLGGAEKRLAGLWLHVVRHALCDMRLVVSEPMYACLCDVDEFADLGRYADRIVRFPGGRFAGLRARSVLADIALADDEAVFHVAMAPPALLPLVPPTRTVFTLAQVTLETYTAKGLFDVLLGTARAASVDVLDADVARELSRILPAKRDDITVTPGSFVDLDRMKPLPFARKKNRLVFLGTFVEGKQVFRLLDQLPRIHHILRSRGFVDVEYDFLGRDVRSPGVAEIVERLSPQIPVRCFYALRPGEILAESKVFFSIQRIDNYPSKSLLEAMACGALPIITDVGKSRQMASNEFAHFVQRDFDADAIAAACADVLSLPEAEFEGRVAKARAFLAQRFTITAMADYYLHLYGRVARGKETR